MFDIITVGSATIDAFLHTDMRKSRLIDIKSLGAEKEFIAYPSGSKIIVQEILFETGGGGTNSAATFASLGFKTGFVGVIGKDHEGERVMQDLRDRGIEFLGYRKGQSGYSIILDSIGHDRTIFNFRGANNLLGLGKAGKEKLKAKWFYFGSMMGKSFQAMEEIARIAKKQHSLIAFNPSNYLCEKGKNYLKEILSRTEVIVLNREEAEILVGKGTEKEMLQRLLALGPKYAVITDGPKGAYATDGKHYYFANTTNVKVVESTGAGDAFASGFVSGLMMDKPMEFSLRLGMCNAEEEIQVCGAKRGLLSKKNYLKAVKKDRRKIIWERL